MKWCETKRCHEELEIVDHGFCTQHEKIDDAQEAELTTLSKKRNETEEKAESKVGDGRLI